MTIKTRLRKLEVATESNRAAPFDDWVRQLPDETLERWVALMERPRLSDAEAGELAGLVEAAPRPPPVNDPIWRRCNRDVRAMTDAQLGARMVLDARAKLADR